MTDGYDGMSNLDTQGAHDGTFEVPEVSQTESSNFQYSVIAAGCSTSSKAVPSTHCTNCEPAAPSAVKIRSAWYYQSSSNDCAILELFSPLEEASQAPPLYLPPDAKMEVNPHT